MYETSHRLRKYQCFFSSGPLRYYNGPYFLEVAHNFENPGAIGPYACFAFPISEGHYINNEKTMLQLHCLPQSFFITQTGMFIVNGLNPGVMS